MSGKRPLTVKTARRLLDRLDLDAEARAEVLKNLLGEPGQAQPSSEPYQVLDEDAFEVIASWEHFALLALLQTRPPRADVRSLAARLGIATVAALTAIRRLERVGMARYDRTSGNWSFTGRPLATKSDAPNRSVRQANRQCIEKALGSLENDSVDVRDITGITLAIDSSKLPLAKAMIKDFRRKLARLLESDSADEVYRLNVQLFPMSKCFKAKSKRGLI